MRRRQELSSRIFLACYRWHPKARSHTPTSATPTDHGRMAWLSVRTLSGPSPPRHLLPPPTALPYECACGVTPRRIKGGVHAAFACDALARWWRALQVHATFMVAGTEDMLRRPPVANAPEREPARVE